jgi:hypothetical protein
MDLRWTGCVQQKCPGRVSDDGSVRCPVPSPASLVGTAVEVSRGSTQLQLSRLPPFCRLPPSPLPPYSSIAQLHPLLHQCFTPTQVSPPSARATVTFPHSDSDIFWASRRAASAPSWTTAPRSTVLAGPLA